MFWRVIFFLRALMAVGVAGVFVLAWHPAYNPIKPPTADAFDAGQVQHGEVLASAGYCATGIGNWSEPAFARASREGISREGSELFPSYRIDHFTKLSAEEVGAPYAYLISQPAVSAPDKANKLPFPLNIRALQAGWKLLFLDKARFTSVPGKDEEWNRGADNGANPTNFIRVVIHGVGVAEGIPAAMMPPFGIERTTGITSS
ncbi:MAG: hypothetical protein ACJAYC_000673 [Halieaceae bacterium]|jgi:hypothetical protein